MGVRHVWYSILGFSMGVLARTDPRAEILEVEKPGAMIKLEHEAGANVMLTNTKRRFRDVGVVVIRGAHCCARISSPDVSPCHTEYEVAQYMLFLGNRKFGKP